MRAVIQRVSQASVTIENKDVRSIGTGLTILLGVARADKIDDVQWMVRKISSMRIFEDDMGKMNRSVQDVGGEILVVSQFTLMADTRKGNRPSFDPAAPRETAIPLYEDFVCSIKSETEGRVKTGEFGASMKLSLINDGPLTIVIDSRNKV